eukprot:3256151-Amphidinium_carterae.1
MAGKQLTSLPNSLAVLNAAGQGRPHNWTRPGRTKLGLRNMRLLPTTSATGPHALHASATMAMRKSTRLVDSLPSQVDRLQKPCGPASKAGEPPTKTGANFQSN